MVEKVTYGVVESTQGNYEMLIITKPDLKEFMSGPDVKMVRWGNFLIYEKISVITLIPILLIIIFNLLVFIVSKRENLDDYKNSIKNIFDVKIIK